MKAKLLYIFLLSMVLTIAAEAQIGFKVTPNPVDTSFTAETDDPVGKAKVVNTGNETISLLWRFEGIKNPGWESYFCDNNFCYGPTVNECPDTIPIVLSPGESGNLDLHHFKTSIVECGMYEVTVWELDNPSNSVTVPFNYNCTSSSNDIAWETMSIYPNPTTNYFQLSESVSNAFVTVNNLIGKTVLRYPISENQVYSVDHLPQGLYMVNIINDNGVIFKSMRLKKI